MSVSSCLLLFIICLSLHFCDCRILGSAEKKKSEDRKFDVSTSKVANNDNNPRSDHQNRINAMYPSRDQSEENSAIKESNSGDSISLIRKTEKIKSNQEKKRSLLSSGNPKGISPASISWQVRRHELPSEKDTELFDSDYSPPKTHPPHHN